MIITILPASGNLIEESSLKSLPSGNTLYVGGDGFGNYTKIQDAIDNASTGDTVFVYEDNLPYYEQINVTKSINLIGEDKNSTVIDSDWISTVLISANNVTLSKFTIKNSREDHGMYQCIHVTSDNNIISDNNVISKNMWYRQGIKLYKANNNEISGNYISNNYHGISISESINTSISYNNVNSNNITGIGVYYDNWHGYSNTKIFGNNISKNSKGIYFFDCSNGYISDNNISNNNEEGMIIERSSNTFIFRNNISNNNGEGMIIDLSSNTFILRNNIFSNNDSGIYLNYESDNNNITENTITSNNHDGIRLNGSSNNTITSNNITSNKYNGISLGLYTYGDTRLYSSRSTIYKNNFLDNKRHAFFEGDWRNMWKQNYWGRPRILPKIIFGRIIYGPIKIPWINIDWHPAKEPYGIGE